MAKMKVKTYLAKNDFVADGYYFHEGETIYITESMVNPKGRGTYQHYKFFDIANAFLGTLMPLEYKRVLTFLTEVKKDASSNN